MCNASMHQFDLRSPISERSPKRMAVPPTKKRWAVRLSTSPEPSSGLAHVRMCIFTRVIVRACSSLCSTLPKPAAGGGAEDKKQALLHCSARDEVDGCVNHALGGTPNPPCHHLSKMPSCVSLCRYVGTLGAPQRPVRKLFCTKLVIRTR
jgi:hypothetical protein